MSGKGRLVTGKGRKEEDFQLVPVEEMAVRKIR